MTDNWSMDSAILHGSTRGLGFDSSHRHKNENFAPVTLLTTIDDHGHMVPVASYISEDVQSTTLANFLRRIKTKIESCAHDIDAGIATIEDRTLDERKRLLANAKEIVRFGWKPSHFMIDKSRAEKSAIREVFPDIIIRVCQFHIIEAIRRWDYDLGAGRASANDRKTGKRTKKRKASLPKEALVEILELFRSTQRCRDTPSHPWSEAQDTFEGRLRSICQNHGVESAARTLIIYFRENWWCDEWRDLCTDIGLPTGQPRDGPFNTNNWTEAAFRTFDRVFLECRKNKRIDRLAAILLNDFLPHYRFWPSLESRPSQAHIDVTRRGHDLWNAGNVKHLGGSKYKVYYLAEKTQRPRSHTVYFDEPRCTCTEFDQRGKFCGHLWAVHWYRSNGPVDQWENATSSDKMAAFAARASYPSRKSDKSTPHDDAWSHGLDHILGKLYPTLYPLSATHEPEDEPEDELKTLTADDHCAISPLGVRMHPPKKQDSRAGQSTLFSSFISPTGFVSKAGRPAPVSPLHHGRSGRSRISTLPVYNHNGSPGRKLLKFDDLSFPPSPTLPSKRKHSNVADQKPPPEKKARTSAASTSAALKTDAGPSKVIKQGPLPMIQHLENVAEEDAIMRGDCDHWMSPAYQLRLEEVDRLVGMLNQLAVTLGRCYICIPSNRVSSFVALIKRTVGENDWTDIPADVSVLFEPDCELQYYINIAKTLPALEGVLFFTLIEDHYILLQHIIHTGQVIGHNSMQPLPPGVDDPYGSYDISDQRILVGFLSKTRPTQMPRITTGYSIQRTGRQFYDPSAECYDNTCGFWDMAFALFIILGIHFNRLPADAGDIKNLIASLWTEYQTSEGGGLTRQLVTALFEPIDRNVPTRLGNRRRDLWAPRRSDLDITSAVYHDYIPMVSGSRGEQLFEFMTLPLDEVLRAEVDMAMRHKNKPILFRNAGNRKIPTYNVSWDDFRRLQPDKWLGDEVVNGYSSLIQNATGSDIVILSSFFITTLCKEGYRKVSRWLKVKQGEGLYSGKISKVVFPVSEPISRPAEDTGSHWTVGVIDCMKKEVSYLNSLRGIGEFHRFKELLGQYLTARATTERQKGCQWVYSERDVPQQTNGFDCGVFSLGNMLTEALGIGRSFHQEDIANLRQHITLQLLRGDLFLPDYRIHSVLPRRSSTPHSTHSQSDLEAAASLLDLSGAQPRVRFSTEIEVREYNVPTESDMDSSPTRPQT